MSSKNIFRLFLLVLAIVAFFSNPKHNDHNAAIDSEFRKHQPIIGAFKGSQLITSFCKYQDLAICSVTYIQGEEDEKPILVSIGFLNKVVVIQDLDLIS